MEHSQEQLEEIIGRRLIDHAEAESGPSVKQEPEGMSPQGRGQDGVGFLPSEGEEAASSEAQIAASDTHEKSPITFTKVEKSLASLGYFTPSSRRIKDQRVKRISFTREIDGKRVEVSAEILPTIFGLPITADQDKYLALHKVMTDILQTEGKITNPIRFTSADLLRLLNKRVRTGKNYKDISDWLKVMTATAIVSKGIVYIAGKKRFVDDTFHVFDRAVSVGKELDDGSIADANYVWLSSWQLENINHKHVMPIDLESYRELKNHIAKALVPLLQIWLFASHRKGTFEKRYDDLCEILNLQRYKVRSLMLRQFKPSLDELMKHGYLAKWRIEKTSDGKSFKVIFVHGPKFHSDRRKRAEQRLRILGAPVVVAESTASDDIEVMLPEPGRLEERPRETRVPEPHAAPPTASAVQPASSEQPTPEWPTSEVSRKEPPETPEAIGVTAPAPEPEYRSPGIASSGEQMTLHERVVEPLAIDPKLIDELVARGIRPSVVLNLLGGLAPDRLAKVGVYIEYWDLQKNVGPGLLYNLIRSGDPLPADFKTAREREEQRAAEERRARQARARQILRDAYEQYARDTADRFIENEFPKEEFTSRLEAKIQELTSSGTMFQKPEIAEQMARHMVWAEVAKLVPVPSFEDFCKSEGGLILAEHRLDATDADMGNLLPQDSIQPSAS